MKRTIINSPIPLVPLECTAQGALWRGKWHFNTSSEWTKSIGGPFETRDDAVKAALETGFYKLRAGMNTPHLDRK